MDNGLWIIFTGIVVSTMGALLGSFLVLRRMAMIGDAISHAVLPGLFIGYAISGTRDNFALLVGAAAFGLLTSILIQYLNKNIRLQSDASIGLVYTLLFSIGVVLISAYAGNSDFDADCVLFGEIAFIPLNKMDFLGMRIPVNFFQLVIGLILIIAFVAIGFKGLKLTSFDPSYAATIGVSIAAWQYTLMGMVSFSTVLSFEAVGAILVIAFLTIPPATAYLLTEKLKTMLLLGVVFGATASVGGYYLAFLTETSLSASMAVFAGLQFACVFAFTRLRSKIRLTNSLAVGQ